MSEQLKKLPINVTVNQYDQLKELADKIGLPVSAYVRMVALEKIKLEKALETQNNLPGMIKGMMEEMEKMQQKIEEDEKK